MIAVPPVQMCLLECPGTKAQGDAAAVVAAALAPADLDFAALWVQPPCLAQALLFDKA